MPLGPRPCRLALALALTCAALVATPPPALGQTAELARARDAYNHRRFDDAIAAATAARRVLDTADRAAIVLGRAHLERYRERADPADLAAARDALASVRTTELGERDRVELLMAFGEALFLQDDFGPAAEVFESGLDAAAAVDPGLDHAMLDWWGSAVERQASTLEPEPRRALFLALAARMKEELARVPTSPAASYWMVVGLRGAGEAARAWDAAVAAWVRARLSGDRAPSLRADLDRVVLQGIIPDRVRHIAPDQRAAAESQLKADWELIKQRWK